MTPKNRTFVLFLLALIGLLDIRGTGIAEAAPNIPSWEAVESKLRWYWQESYPEEKVIEIKNPKTAPEYGNEKVDDSLLSYRHVYIPAELIAARPNGAKYLNKVTVAYYQLSAGSPWTYHYVPGADPIEIGKATRVNPLKTTPAQVLELLKQYVDLMMKNNFPPYQSKENYKKNAVEIKITKVDFEDAAKAADQIGKTENQDYAGEDKDARLSINFVIEGEYKDLDGSFKFRVTNLLAEIYPVVQGGFWTLSSDRKPMDQTTLSDVRGLKDALFSEAFDKGPRETMMQWAPKLSLRDQAMENLASHDSNRRHEGITAARFQHELSDDGEYVQALIKLLPNTEDCAEVKNSLDIIKKDTTKDSIKQAIAASVGSSQDARREDPKYKSAVDELKSAHHFGWGFHTISSEFTQTVLRDEATMEIIFTEYSKPDGARNDIKKWFEAVITEEKDNMSPAMLNKISEALKGH